MLFLRLCKSKEKKAVPEIKKKNKGGNHGERVPVRSVLPPARDPGVSRTSGRRGRCGAGAATPRVPPGPQGGGRWLQSQRDPLSGSPYRQGSGGDPARDPGRRRGAHTTPRAGLCAAPRRPRGCASAPALPLPDRGWGSSAARGRGRGGAGPGAGAGRCLPRRPAAPSPGAPTWRGVPEYHSPSASWGVNAESL